MLVERGKKMADEIRSELSVSTSFIQGFCGLSAEFFERSSSAEFVPSLK